MRGEKLVNELGGVLGLVFLIQRQVIGMVHHFFLKEEGKQKTYIFVDSRREVVYSHLV